MNPDQTAAACERCTKGQQHALEMDAKITPLAKAHTDALELMNVAELKEKAVLEKQVEAQGAYNAAMADFRTAAEATTVAISLRETAKALEIKGVKDANLALEATKLDCKGFNLPLINIPPSPSPPPPNAPPPSPPPPIHYYSQWSGKCTPCPGRFYGGSHDNACYGSCSAANGGGHGGRFTGSYYSNRYVNGRPKAGSSGERGCGWLKLGCELLCKCQIG